jgi:hypothetical protein
MRWFTRILLLSFCLAAFAAGCTKQPDTQPDTGMTTSKGKKPLKEPKIP